MCNMRITCHLPALLIFNGDLRASLSGRVGGFFPLYFNVTPSEHFTRSAAVYVETKVAFKALIVFGWQWRFSRRPEKPFSRHSLTSAMPGRPIYLVNMQVRRPPLSTGTCCVVYRILHFGFTILRRLHVSCSSGNAIIVASTMLQYKLQC